MYFLISCFGKGLNVKVFQDYYTFLLIFNNYEFYFDVKRTWTDFFI